MAQNQDEGTEKLRVRKSLEPCREIVVCLKNIFTWKNSWHPYAIVGFNTVIFTLLWLLEPNIVTVVAILGLIITVMDYFLPTILATNLVFNEEWTSIKEEEFDKFCGEVVYWKNAAKNSFGNFLQLRATNKKMHFCIVGVSLLMLAYLGNTINNLFMAYILSNLFTLWPGLKQHNIVQKWMGEITKKVAEFLFLLRNAIASARRRV